MFCILVVCRTTTRGAWRQKNNKQTRNKSEDRLLHLFLIRACTAYKNLFPDKKNEGTSDFFFSRYLKLATDCAARRSSSRSFHKAIEDEMHYLR